MVNKASSKKNKGNPSEILDLASQFYKAYLRCSEYKPIGNGKVEDVFIPAYVNLAFACELYLKALLKLKGEKSINHSLLKIFNYLEKQDQSITDAIINLTNTMTSFGFTIDSFKFQLKTISNTFKKWRYCYEWRSNYMVINGLFFNVFSYALYLICEKFINNKELNFDNYKNIISNK